MSTGLPPSSGPRAISSQKKQQTFLSFDLLEDVMFLPAPKYAEIIEQANVVRIGPLVEYAYHHYEEVVKELRLRSDNEAAISLTKTLQVPKLSRLAPDTSVNARPIEFYKVPQSLEEVEDNNWMAFLIRLGDAGVKAGLAKQFSQALAGTFEEM